jgi:hypothetical protein
MLCEREFSESDLNRSRFAQIDKAAQDGGGF